MTDTATTEEARTWAQLILANNPHDDTRRVARWILAAAPDPFLLRVRQFFCMHDWSCGWSRQCTGDHHCLKCGHS